ncbi:hypothetical protein BBJ41_12845 [Burkholderia stabilis]|uniref:hypothetical protein n=1 Tax=Burkholderia stabilis TaxID=95485 RepID=UPI00085178F9|nr:hypothetical protein [Burkholderia stabilis]AOR68338.1 hypothetical protein BBJ41_12845 [Burkholderia stabilis]HDR9495538.1 hypothetical protein [Burkholderia stabilis]HDR9526651.1 hypothetical protein [Burkholderia stabilis]HDR9534133.1 hypothetical protein [Burkholderia stabilis]HDR9540663.1 hypothetical protein [Burkholderia stabilis]
MKAKNQVVKNFVVGVAAAGSALVANAQAATTPVDVTPITSAVDFGSVVVGIMSVASVMVGVYVAWRAAKFALRAVRGL